jgi:hypothetical protein
MQIVQQMMEKFLQISEEILDVMENGLDYVSFEVRLREKLNELGREVCKSVLESADQRLLESRSERPGWIIQRRDDKKSILTPFGEVKYKRTYYKHAKTKQYAYLVDKMAGHGPHARMDLALSAEAVENSSELSYRKSGQRLSRMAPEAGVSGQTVMKAIRRFDLEEKVNEVRCEKKKCEVLYVEADEDHVAGQDGRTYMPYLVYVHEGKNGVKGKRRKLKSPRYFSGLYKEADELWLWVLNYIEENYDMNILKTIFVCGDGAAWIKTGLRILPKSVFVLDMFHLKKRLVSVFGRDSEDYSKAWKAIGKGDRLTVERLIKKAMVFAQTPNQMKTACDCQIYIRNNWGGITAYQTYPEADLGVSAEGHVSHILSDRLSSRPMGWSRIGVDQMSRIRALKANEVPIKKKYLEQHLSILKPLKVLSKVVEQERKALKRVVGEVSNNLPVLNGKAAPLRQLLRSISHGEIW